MTGKYERTAQISSVRKSAAARKRWRRWTVLLSVVVAAGTALALTLPAITMNRGLYCGLEEHTHTPQCYAEGAQVGLICNPQAHVHTDSCYDGAGTLICGQTDFLLHTHEGLCYDGAGKLICYLPEVKAHTHSELCYQDTTVTVDPGHTHTDDCYVWTPGSQPVCGEEERPGHLHKDGCYNEDGTLGCTTAEDPGHMHGAACFEKIKGELTCTETERAPVTQSGEPEKICTLPEIGIHTHGQACLVTGAYVCGQGQAVSHVHDQSCMGYLPEPVCGLEEHTHTDQCVPVEALTDEQWIRRLPQQLNVELGQDLLATAASQLGYSGDPENRAAGADGQIRSATIYGTWAGAPYDPWQSAFAAYCLEYIGVPEALLPRAADVAGWYEQLGQQKLLLTEGEKAGDLAFLDTNGDGIADTIGILTDPLADVPVVWFEILQDETAPMPQMLYLLQGDHMGQAAQVAYRQQLLMGFVSMDQLQSRYLAWLEGHPEVKPYTRTQPVTGAALRVAWGVQAKLPADTVLTVTEPEVASEEYYLYTDQIAACPEISDIYSIHLFDITLTDSLGTALEPAEGTSVDLTVRFDAPIGHETMTYHVVHFDHEAGMELLEATPIVENEAVVGIQFSQDSFSVSGVVVSDMGGDISAQSDISPMAEEHLCGNGYITMSNGSSDDPLSRIADPVTVEKWKDTIDHDHNKISTEYAGGIRTDKSVTAGAISYGNNSGSGSIAANPGEFLVGLSTIASTQTVAGMRSTPTDVMFVLDMSSSMYGGSTAMNPDTVTAMVDSLNESIAHLNTLNANNRVGVVLYWGGGDVTVASTTGHGRVLMPLDRYATTNGTTFIDTKISSGKLTGIKVNSGVTNSAGAAVTGNHNSSGVAGTYAQLGILLAKDQFMAASTELSDGTPRRPVFVFMTDGKPTAAREGYTSKGTATMGNNREASRSSAETDFVTQLTAAYAKAAVDAHYYNEEKPQGHALFYTLGLGQNDVLALDILNPGNVSVTGDACNNGLNDGKVINISNKIKSYWEDLLADGTVTFTTKSLIGSWTAYNKSHTVKTTTVDGKTFPASLEDQKYADRFFQAATRAQLQDAFASIMLEISLQQSYTATEVVTNHDTDGYVTFVDTIGQYMTVTEMEGIILNGELNTGRLLAMNFPKNVVTNPESHSDLGTMTEPTALGKQFMLNLGYQLGLEPSFEGSGNADYRTAMNAVAAAYYLNTLYYTSDSDFSNYIEWWAAADSTGGHTYLGIYHPEGAVCGSDDCAAAGHYATPPPGATHKIRSYFYLGTTTKGELGTMVDSNMMYAMVMLREDVQTKEESVIFAVPNSLLPTVDYYVGLDMDRKIMKLEVSGADTPVMLAYQVGLSPEADMEQILAEGTYPGIVRDGTGEDVRIQFYSNAYDTANSYSDINTYAYFTPDKDNDRYYYTGPIDQFQDSPTPIYTLKAGAQAGSTADSDYQLLTSEPVEGGVYYERFQFYTLDNGQLSEVVKYRPLTTMGLDAAAQAANGTWYIPPGTPYNLSSDRLSAWTVAKNSNNTGTLAYADVPYNDAGGETYINGAILGNNGRIGVSPVILSGTKTMQGISLEDYTFQFDLLPADSSFAVAPNAQPLQTVNNSGSEWNEILFDPIWPIDPGTFYYVVRERSHPGVICDTTEYWITLTVNQNLGHSVTVVKGGTDVPVAQDALDFVNRFGAELPATGGSGTLLYTLGGLSLMGTAGLLYSHKRKRRREEEA